MTDALNNGGRKICAKGLNNCVYNGKSATGVNYDKTIVSENNNYINGNTSEICGKGDGDERSQKSQSQGYRRSQCNVNEIENNSKCPPKGRYASFKNNQESHGQTELQFSDPTSILNNKNRIVGPCMDQENSSDPANTRTSGRVKDDFIYIGTVRDEERSVGPDFLREGAEALHSFFRGTFFWKYSKNRNDASTHLLRNIFTHNITDADVDQILKGKRKPHCSRCQYCFFLTCLTCTGGLMPPTPSPFSTPNRFESKWQNLVKNPISTTLTELQYNSLYRDFKHASQLELKGPAFEERLDKLGALVEKEMLKIIHTFTSEVFTTLVEEYLKLFEEMVKGLILLKETGITLEDICSMGEESQATWTTNLDSKISSCQPYKAAEFEKLLLDELVKQHDALLDTSKCGRKTPRESNYNAIGKEIPIRDSEDDPRYQNPYLSFLIHCHTLPSCSREEFGQILHVEKQMFLKDCLKLLRDNDYFRFHNQSSSQSEHFIATLAECSSPEGLTQQSINENEMYKMSVRIYNKTICHVQSAILAICRSMQYDKQGTKRLLPLTPDKSSRCERVLKVSESKDLIKKSLSDYLKPADRSASSEDEVFINGSLHIDSTLHDCSIFKKHKGDGEIPAMSSINYVNEIKYPCGHKYGLKYERGYVLNEDNKQDFPALRQEIMQQHPDLDYADASCHKSQGMIQNTPEVAKKDFLSQNVQASTARTVLSPEIIQDNKDKMVILPQTRRETEANFLDRPLFRRKKNDVRIICVLNYYEPEISHYDAIDFLKKMDSERGILHYPHCSENTSITKMDGPSFYLSVCCVDCRQELAPPQKLEAFKSEPTLTHRSKLMSHILRKSSASYFPVQCGSCKYFLRDPHKPKKQHLLVPFHSSAKGHICASRLKSHVCETVLSQIEYTGCLSDAINSSNTQNIQKIIEKGAKRRQPHDFLNTFANHGHMVRSRSLPIIEHRKDHDYGDMENYNEKVRGDTTLNFEDAVANILNMWTYEMIDYEKGANSPHLRSQILNYRKSLSIFIKKDIREKLYYRHILSVFKRVENYESPILDFKNKVSAQKSELNCKIIRKSRSCHSKLSYEATSAARGNYDSLEFDKNIINTRQQRLDSEKGVRSSYLRPAPQNRRNIARPLSLHSEIKQKTLGPQRRRSYSFTESIYEAKNSTQMNAWKYELQELQKGIESPDLRSQSFNRKSMARPLSFHSELKHKTSPTHGRRRSSCSFGTESGYKDVSTQITAWKNELLKLEKSAESPHLGYESRNRNIIARPLSLHSEIFQKPATHRRRSCSFTESEYKEEFFTQMNSWKNELHKLQKSVESPDLRCGAINRINYARGDSLHSEPKVTTTAATHRPKSESFINKFSAQINKSNQELLKLQKSLETINRKNLIRTRGDLLDERKPLSAAPYCQPESVVIKDVELTAWKHELLKLQKSVDSPELKSETLNHKMNKRTSSLDSDSKPTSTTTRRSISEIDDTLTELKTWNYKLRELERDATSPYLRHERMSSKIKTRALSLHTPERPTTLSRNRPKSASVLDDFSTELATWKHTLLTLEEDAKNSQPETQNRKNMAKSRSLSSESKYNNAVRVNFESMDKKGDISRRNLPMGPIHKPLEPNFTTRTSSQNKSTVCRYSATPRQLPAIPNTRNVRRHSHYETTGNFVNLLSDRNTTHLSTHKRDNTAPTCNGPADPGLIPPRDKEPDGFLRPDEGTARARFLSQ